MISGNRDVPGIADNVNDLLIPGIETVVTLEYPWQAVQLTVGKNVDGRNAVLDIRECDGLILIDQVAEQKARPGVARLRIGDDEKIIGKDSHAAACGHTVKNKSSRLLQMRSHLTNSALLFQDMLHPPIPSAYDDELNAFKSQAGRGTRRCMFKLKQRSLISVYFQPAGISALPPASEYKFAIRHNIPA